MSIEFNILRGGFSIRAAGSKDAKPLRMLLPGLRDAAVHLVAVDGEHQLVIGAAAASRSNRPQPLVGPGIALHVIEPCRHNGVGKSLLSQLVRAMHGTSAKALYAAKRVEQDSQDAQRWLALGFKPCESVIEHLLPLDEFEPRLAPLLERMRGRIPPEARIIPLYESNLPSVLRLHLDHMGGERGELYRKLRGQGVGAFHPRYSRVLVVDDAVRGCILAHRKNKETAVVDANILDPTLRGGWANVWLKLEATRGALRLGIKHFQFTTFDQYQDTRSFTVKLGGEIVRTSHLMMLAITDVPE